MRAVLPLLLLLLLSTARAEVTLHWLSSLYPRLVLSGRLLSPIHESDIFPRFVSLPASETSQAHVHVKASHLSELLATLSSTGLLATAICSYAYMNNTYFVVNSDVLAGTQELLIESSVEALQEKVSRLTDERVPPVHICAGPTGRTFSAVWHRRRGAVQHFIVQEEPLSLVVQMDVVHGREGYFPDVLQVYDKNNTPTALAVWRKGYGVRYRLISLSDLSLLGETMDGLSPEMFVSGVSSFSAPHRRTLFLFLARTPSFTWRDRDMPIARVWTADNLSTLSWLEPEVERAMREHEIPSISLSLRRDGRELFTAAYGYADLRARRQAQPGHAYRLASISKTLTAMAVADLIEEGKMRLEDRVFGEGGLLSLGSAPLSPVLQSITVRQLLEHSSGGWSHAHKLEFKNTHLSTHESFLSWVVDSHPPTTQTDTQYIYSNIGYILLGRVIEKVSNNTYDSFVRTRILHPLGIDGHIGERAARGSEVTYYSPDNANPYSTWSPRRMDAAAGWMMRPRDVSLLFEHLWRHRFTRYRIVSTRSRNRWEYGRGVQVGGDGALYHVGSLAGSEAVAYAQEGASMCLVANVRGEAQNRLTEWMRAIAARATQHIN